MKLKKTIPIITMCAMAMFATGANATTEKDVLSNLKQKITIQGKERSISDYNYAQAEKLLSDANFDNEDLETINIYIDDIVKKLKDSNVTRVSELSEDTKNYFIKLANELAEDLNLKITIDENLNFTVGLDVDGKITYYKFIVPGQSTGASTSTGTETKKSTDTSSVAQSSTASNKTSTSTGSKVIKSTGMHVDNTGSIALLYLSVASIGTAVMAARKKKMFED